MTDLELMELLEAEGYEPDVENLILLKEGIESGEIEILNEARKSTKKLSKIDVYSDEWDDATPEEKSRVHAMEAGHERDQKRGYEHKVDALRKKKGHMPKDTGNHNPSQPRETAAAKVRAERQIDTQLDSVVKERKESKKRAEELKKKREETEKKYKEIRSRLEAVKESYSDYELYQILESNGYTTTEANLSILKEGLDSGKYYIEEGLNGLGARLSPEDQKKTNKHNLEREYIIGGKRYTDPEITRRSRIAHQERILKRAKDWGVELDPEIIKKHKQD